MNEQDIGHRLRSRRKQLGLTQLDVAALAATNRDTVTALERASSPRGATLATLIAVASVLGLVVELADRPDSE